MTANEFGVDPDESRRSLLLAHACATHPVDAFVTESPTLRLDYWRNLRTRAHVMGPVQAIALLGLHLRAHRNFTVRVCDDGSSTFLQPERFYRATAVAALSRYASWLGHSIQQGKSGDPRLHVLLRGMEVRLGRAIWVRDYFAVRVRHDRPDDTWDECLLFFETFLLLLQGALDAAARFCHLALELRGHPREAGWQRGGWRRHTLAVAPNLAGLLDEQNGALLATTRAIAVLRNYIHGEALSDEFFVSGEGMSSIAFGEGAIAVGRNDGERLRRAVGVLGEDKDWGIDNGMRDATLVYPASYVSSALPVLLQVLDELMNVLCLDSGHELGDSEARNFWLTGHGYEHEVLLLTGLRRS